MKACDQLFISVLIISVEYSEHVQLHKGIGRQILAVAAKMPQGAVTTGFQNQKFSDWKHVWQELYSRSP